MTCVHFSQSITQDQFSNFLKNSFSTGSLGNCHFSRLTSNDSSATEGKFLLCAVRKAFKRIGTIITFLTSKIHYLVYFPLLDFPYSFPISKFEKININETFFFKKNIFNFRKFVALEKNADFTKLKYVFKF